MRTWSVRTKLLAFACIVLAPVTLVAYLSAQNDIAVTRSQILSSSGATASVAVATVDDFLVSAERLLLIMASTGAVQHGDMAAVSDLFTNTLRLSPEYLSLYVLDANGTLQARAPNPLPSANDMRFGSEALRSGATSISGRLGGTERLTAALAVPIRNAGLVRGALGVEFALDRLERSIADSVMHEHALVLVLDSTGRVLVAPEARYYADNNAWSDVPPVQAALRGEQGAAEYRNPIDGNTWLGAYAPVRRAGWAVLVSYPDQEVFSPLRAATLTAALSLGGVTLLAVGLAVFLAARFTRPLQEVKRVALSIARGDYERRVPQAGLPHDEIGQLALAFNQMAEALQAHMVALMDAQREIEQKASDLQQLLDRSVMVQETERRRIAQEIHDGITQMLVGALYEMQAAKQMLAVGGDSRPATQKLTEALGLISETITEIRRVILDLHPTILDELGLVPALQRLSALFESGTLRCSLQVEGAQARLSSTQELALYRIAQEALNNVRRHAGASQVLLTLSFGREHTTLTVRDDGRGMPDGATPSPFAAPVGGALAEPGAKGIVSRTPSFGPAGEAGLTADPKGLSGRGGAAAVPTGPEPPRSGRLAGETSPADALSARGLGRAGSTPAKTAGQVEPAGDRAMTGAKEHLGLIGMKERAQSVGGQFEVRTKGEGGTSIVVTLPRMPVTGKQDSEPLQTTSQIS
jgi:signal transduction histidine kinase